MTTPTLEASKSTDSEHRDTEKSYFRSPRTVYINSYWYFLSRERGPEGPFNTREDADAAVQRYIQLVTSPLFKDGQMSRINALTV
ncbi:MAG: DUF6316 family protein [Pseudomonadales bacterium]